MAMKLIGSRPRAELREYAWVALRRLRYKPTIDFSRPAVYNILGIRDSGKSTLNEVLALNHSKIIDWHASRDNESLAWCRESSPIDDNLLVTGDNVDLQCSWPTKRISDLTLKDILDFEGIVTCNSFFSSQDSKFLTLQKLPDILYQRLGWEKGKLIFLIVRESNSFLYSRQRMGAKIKDAKAEFVYFTREIRHFGCSSGIDLLRWTGTDKDLRDNAEFTLIKQVGDKGVPADKRFIYKYLSPVAFARMAKNRFFMIKNDGSLALGRFPALKFHKEEGVDLLKELGIVVEYGEEIDEGAINKLGDGEHAQIIRSYVDIDCSSMLKVSKQVRRSQATIHSHITEHNKAVEKKGFCPKCRRWGSDLEDVIAVNERYKQ